MTPSRKLPLPLDSSMLARLFGKLAALPKRIIGLSLPPRSLTTPPLSPRSTGRFSPSLKGPLVTTFAVLKTPLATYPVTMPLLLRIWLSTLLPRAHHLPLLPLILPTTPTSPISSSIFPILHALSRFPTLTPTG